MISPRQTDRILTTHAGSLPRPGALLDLVYAQEAGRPVDADRWHREVQDAVRETVDRQRAAGVDVVNDGEVSKPSYATYVKDRLTGMGGEGSVTAVTDRVRGLEDFPDLPAPVAAATAATASVRFTTCTGPVAFEGAAAVAQDVEHLRAAVGDGVGDESGAFMSSASPGVISVFSPNRYYGSEEEYVGAIAEAMRTEYEAIHAAGFLLQLDCPDLAMTYPGAESLAAFRRSMALNIEALNHAVANIPAEAMRIHVCWGNGESPRARDVELKDIVDLILTAKPAGVMLMAANGRHEHEWSVFRDTRLPDGKYVIAGVLDSTTNIIEHPEVVAERLVRYAGVVGKENVMAGTDCGFGTIAGMQTIAPSVVWAKFRAQAEGARIASERLWG